MMAKRRLKTIIYVLILELLLVVIGLSKFKRGRIKLLKDHVNGSQNIFFNRVPKVGSGSIVHLLKRLGPVHDFDVHHHETLGIKLKASEEAELTAKINNYNRLGSRPFVFIRHVVFTNFTRNNYSMPTFINLVRDPIERVISFYYFTRYVRFRRRQGYHKELPPHTLEWLKKDFEECYLNGDEECTYVKGSSAYRDHRSQAAFFCGNEENCLNFNDDWVVQRAKENVERYYTVVGVTEEMDLTLKVLEHYLPRYFSRATEIYNEYNLRNVNQNKEKPFVSPEVKGRLKKDFEAEFDFYEYCKQRLHLQAKSINQE